MKYYVASICWLTKIILLIIIIMMSIFFLYGQELAVEISVALMFLYMVFYIWDFYRYKKRMAKIKEDDYDIFA